MDEGKNLLISIIEDKLSKLSSLNTENLYIEGDNLEVLKLLQETYLMPIYAHLISSDRD